MSKRKQSRRPAPLAEHAQSTERDQPPSPLSRGTAVAFAPAILTGALLLFAVQPLIARYLLPWFGGGPGVWATCMLFFQALLLGGYLYAHLSVRHLSLRGQIILHLILLAGALAMIPIIPAAHWKPTATDDPAWRILLLLGATIGLPYFVLSATSPLLQSWFVKARPGVSPYRLFALSNLGSLVALLAYPTILEPLFTRRQQAWIWSGGLVIFSLTCAACALHVWKRAAPSPLSPTVPPPDSAVQKSPGTRLLWLALPMVASVLLLAITNTLTEDVAGTPLLWVIPLALYLLTFVIAFDGPRGYRRRIALILLPLCAAWMIRLNHHAWLKLDVSLLEQFVGYLAGLFVMCLFCHGELARLKPDPSRLTGYYLLIALGGALGGMLVALAAPRVFDRLLELPLGVLAAALLSFVCLRGNGKITQSGASPTHAGAKTTHAGAIAAPARAKAAHAVRGSVPFILVAVAFAAMDPLVRPFVEGGGKVVVDRSRNFYGTLVVADLVGPDPSADIRVLYHGSISHGFQFLQPQRRKEPTLYYREGSGVSVALHNFPGRLHLRVGLVGLGAGTLAAYGRSGDAYRFYEIDPDVERMARTYFTFLADTSAKTEVILGDARLALEREESQAFDVIVLDAFSGDAIPTHLLTAEAFNVYRRHLAPGGIIVAHFSNRSVDLGPVLLRQASRLGMSALVGDPRAGWWMLMTRNEAFLSSPPVRRLTQPVAPSDRAPLWTDDYMNLIQAIRWLPDVPANP